MSIRRSFAGALVGALLIALLSPFTMSQAAVTTPVSDSFERTVARGWGSAPAGGQWVLDSTYQTAVAGGRASMLVPGGAERSAYLPTQIAGEAKTTATVTFPVLPDQAPGIRAGLTLRREGDSYYVAAVRVLPGGQVLLSLSVVSQPFLDSRLTFERFVGSIEEGGSVTIATEVTDAPATLVQAKAWVTGAAEPQEFQVAGGSSSAPSSGFVGFVVEAANEAAGTAVAFDSIKVEQGSEDVPENVGPQAAFAYQMDYRTISVDGIDSSDPDGTITSYTWNYGDGDEGLGVTDSHTYAKPGTYTVTLTVTDDAGATNSTSQQVVIPEYQPPNAGSTGVPDDKVDSLKLASTTPLPYPNDTRNDTRIVINTPGAIYDGWRFDRLVDVKARGVIFRNSYFEGVNGNPGDSALVRVLNDRTNNQVPSAVVEDSTLIPKYPNDTIDGVRGSNFTLRRVEIAKTVDGMQIYGNSSDYEDAYAGNVLVEESWIHDLIWYDNDSHVNGTHNDGMQIRGGRNITLFSSRIDGPMNGAPMQISQPINRVADITVVGNVIGGGGCSINVYDGQGPGPVEGMTVVLNGFVRGSTTTRDCAVIMSERTMLVASVDYNAWTDNSQPPPGVQKGRGCFGYEWDPDLEQFRPVGCPRPPANDPAEAGETGSPAVDPPAADPPAADPSAVDPPATDSPAADPSVSDPPTSEAPATDAPPQTDQAQPGQAPARLETAVTTAIGQAPIPV